MDNTPNEKNLNPTRTNVIKISDSKKARDLRRKEIEFEAAVKEVFRTFRALE